MTRLRSLCLALGLVLGLAGPAHAAFGDFVQTTSTFSVADHPVTVVMGSNVTQGNLIVVWTSSSATETIGITDTQSNLWAEAIAHRDVPNDIGWSMWFTVARFSDALTITITGSPGTGSTVTYANEYAGPFAASPLDDASSGQDVTATSSTGTITPTVGGSLFVAGHLLGADGTEASGGWTNDIDELGGAVAFLIFSHVVQGAAAADAGEATLSAQYWIAAGANFKPATVSGSTRGRRGLMGVGR